MNLKSITFRCSEPQLERLETLLNALCPGKNRTDFLSAALGQFLDFAESAPAAGMDLFEMVARIDADGDGTSFADQA